MQFGVRLFVCGAVWLANTNSEYLEGITFGSHINFNLKFAGTGAESVFTLSLLNATQDDALLISNVNNGFLLEFTSTRTVSLRRLRFPQRRVA